MSWIVGLVLIAAGAALLATCWWGSQGRLPRNKLVGIRIPSTMCSDAAWDAGHRAAAAPLGLAGGVAVCAGIGVATSGPNVIGAVFIGIGIVAMLAGAAVATVAASRAAKDVTAQTGTD